MSVLFFTSLIFVTSLFAGHLGALTGLGGGVVIVPVLVLLFQVDLRYAVGASLISVIATSSGAAAAYVREGLSNIRIGMFLEIATTLGALLGAYLSRSLWMRTRTLHMSSAHRSSRSSHSLPQAPRSTPTPCCVPPFPRLSGGIQCSASQR